MERALSDPPHKGQVAGPVVWLNLLVCLSVYSVYRIRPVLKDLFLFLKSHIWHGPKLVTELGMHKGLCSSLLCARVGLCCTLRRTMQFLLPELVKVVMKYNIPTNTTFRQVARACKAVYLC